MSSQVIYPGTFDPITNGHLDLIVRALGIFDTVIVAVSENSRKHPKFTCNERMALIQEALAAYNNQVIVRKFSGLLIDFAKTCNVNVIVRGLRAVSDFEYEFQLAGMNRSMCPQIETIFLTPSEKFSYISASLVREIAELGGDVSAFVPKPVAQALKQKMLSSGIDA